MRRLCFIVIFAFLSFSLAAFAEEPAAKSKKSSSSKKAAAGKKGAKKGAKKDAKKQKSAKVKPREIAPVVPLELPAEKPGQHTAEVREVRHWSTPDYTRVAVTLDREASFEKHEIARAQGSPILSRIYFDINGARLAPGVKDLNIGDGILKSARVAQYRADTARVVLDVENVRDYKIFTFSDPFRIIIDVKGERPAAISALPPVIKSAVLPVELSSKEIPKAAAKEPGLEPAREPQAQKPKPRSQVKPGKIRRIVVDPGHGGKDPGAVGPTGRQEKDVVLAMGLDLARKLREELGVDVVMTRSTDVFIELQERTAIANQVGADLFVSIHANASLNRNASGVETYYLNLAKTEKAAQLAARENGTSLEKVSVLQAVLFDLMANYKLNDSAHMADEVQKALHKRLSGKYSSVKNLGVKQGPFYVLVGATMPSILVETAFISNEREESRLGDPQFRDQAAEGIFEGIAAYVASLK